MQVYDQAETSEQTEEDILENIQEQKDLIDNVKFQPWRMSKKLKILRLVGLPISKESLLRKLVTKRCVKLQVRTLTLNVCVCVCVCVCASFQPGPHDLCNKGRGMVHIKEPLLLFGNGSPCGGNRFPHSLSEWSFTICLTPYNRK